MRKSFHLGFDYYPEHWPEKMWAEDLSRMHRLGVTVVRIAEFAWSRMEPEEGRFEFDWLDRFFKLAAKHDISIVLGTPTAAPPPWARQAYPDIVRAQENGLPAPTTSRRYTCPTNPSYLELCATIVEQMASRYGAHKQLVGWQTDNEVGGEICFCEHCRNACREWLKRKYGSVDALNKAHGLVFWAHEVTEWEQVILPRPGLDKAHPSVRLDVHRFFSHAWSGFLRAQTDLIRKHSPRRWVTHNLPGVAIPMDLFELAEAHDFLSIDTYPRALINGDHQVAFVNDVTRSVQARPHWVMELQSGTPCTKFYKAPVPRDGQLRLWAHQSAAHGAEGVVFFRWRKSPVGQEMFGNGLLDHDSRQRRTFDEVRRLGADFARLSKRLPRYDAPKEAAIVLDFADRIHTQIHEFAMDVPFMPHITAWWRAARRHGLNVRFVRSMDDLTAYRLVVAPTQFVTAPEIVDNFTEFVRAGGTLVGMLRMGVFDVHGKPSCQTLPGGMTELFGVEVEEYERVMEPNPNCVVFADEIGGSAECRNWNYILHDLGAKALGTYVRDYYAGRTAVSVNDLGSGHAVYVGTMLDQDGLDRVMAYLARLAGLPVLSDDWPADVEMVRLVDGKKPVRAILNHSLEPRCVALPKPMTDLLTGKTLQKIDLEPLGVRWMAAKGRTNAQ